MENTQQVVAVGSAEIELIREEETRDPVLIAKKLVRVINTELGRYEAATRAEKDILAKTGLVNPHITEIAKSVIASAQRLANIANPPKMMPFGGIGQQNNIFIGGQAAQHIQSLPNEKREEALKVIDALILNGRETEGVPSSSDSTAA
jgi:hypothetical protein